MKCVVCSSNTHGKYGKHPVCAACYSSDRLFEWLHTNDPPEYQVCLEIRLAAATEKDQTPPTIATSTRYDMNHDDFITEAHRSASAWARKLLSVPTNHWIILDTETTGLDENAEVIQIGVTDGAGTILMDNIACKPLRPIPAEATAIHHITNEMVQNAAPFQSAWDTLTRIVDGKIVVVYNAAYDRRLLNQSASRLPLPEPLLPVRWECAMLKYAEWVGEWNDYHGSFRWQKLKGGDHSALGDCIATLETIRKMAACCE